MLVLGIETSWVDSVRGDAETGAEFKNRSLGFIRDYGNSARGTEASGVLSFQNSFGIAAAPRAEDDYFHRL